MKKRRNHKLHRKGIRQVLFCLLALLGFFFPFSVSGCAVLEKKESIHIACDTTPESRIFAEMAVQMLESRGLDTRLTVVEKGSSDIHPALLGGNFDLYPEYLETAWNFVLKEKESYTDADYGTLKEEYGEMGLDLAGVNEIESSLSLAVRKDTADEYHLKTLSDLARVSSGLTLGAPGYFFSREDQYPLLQNVYGFDFKTIKNLPDNMLYRELKADTIDVIPVRNTDGLLKNEKMVILEDNFKAFPDSSMGFIVRQDAESAYQIEQILNKLTGSISHQEIAELNEKVSRDGMAPSEAVYEFLTAKGFIDESGR